MAAQIKTPATIGGGFDRPEDLASSDAKLIYLFSSAGFQTAQNKPQRYQCLRR
jgi:hypothetical protein